MLAIKQRPAARPQPPRLPDRRRRRRRRPDHRLPRAARPCARRLRPPDAVKPVQRLYPHRPRQHGHGALGAHGRRPGHLYRHRHPGRRGARRRLGADAGRGRRGQPQALRQPRPGAAPSRAPAARTSIPSSWERYRQAGAIGARHAGRGGGRRPGACRRARSRSRTACSATASGKSAELRRAGRHGGRRCRRRPTSSSRTRRAWVYIGNEKLRRLDSVAKTTGRQQFPIDVQLPGMLTAVHRAPAAVRRQGELVRRRGGQAGEGRGRRGRDAARRRRRRQGHLVGDQGPRGARRSSGTRAGPRRAARDRAHGRVQGAGALRRGARWRATTATPPAPSPARPRWSRPSSSSPTSPTPRWSRSTPWRGSRTACSRSGPGTRCPTSTRRWRAEIMGIEPAQVKLHVMTPGGFFGRRAVPDADIIVEVVSTLKAIGARAPVKVLWTREDDMTRRPLPADVLPHAEGRARRGRQPGRLAAPDRRPVDPDGHAVRGRAGQARRRRDLGRGRLDPALRDPQPARSTS